MTKQEKQKQKAVEAAFKKHANCVQIPIMNLGKIMEAGRNAESLEAVDLAVKEAVEKYRAA